MILSKKRKMIPMLIQVLTITSVYADDILKITVKPRAIATGCQLFVDLLENGNLGFPGLDMIGTQDRLKNDLIVKTAFKEQGVFARARGLVSDKNSPLRDLKNYLGKRHPELIPGFDQLSKKKMSLDEYFTLTEQIRGLLAKDLADDPLLKDMVGSGELGSYLLAEPMVSAGSKPGLSDSCVKIFNQDQWKAAKDCYDREFKLAIKNPKDYMAAHVVLGTAIPFLGPILVSSYQRKEVGVAVETLCFDHLGETFSDEQKPPGSTHPSQKTDENKVVPAVPLPGTSVKDAPGGAGSGAQSGH